MCLSKGFFVKYNLVFFKFVNCEVRPKWQKNMVPYFFHLTSKVLVPPKHDTNPSKLVNSQNRKSETRPPQASHFTNVYFTEQLTFLIFQSAVCTTVWNVSKYGVFPSPYFPIFGQNTEIYEVNLPIPFKFGKIWARKNSEVGHLRRIH